VFLLWIAVLTTALSRTSSLRRRYASEAGP
jgi:hypothetical protein